MFPTPPPVVEELQVQILKLLLNNKDDNGVSDSQTPAWVPGRDGCWYWGPETQRAGTGSGSHSRAQAKAQHRASPLQGQLLTASFFLPSKGEASRYIFLTKFRKFLQENASGRGVSVHSASPPWTLGCVAGSAPQASGTSQPAASLPNLALPLLPRPLCSPQGPGTGLG